MKYIILGLVQIIYLVFLDKDNNYHSCYLWRKLTEPDLLGYWWIRIYKLHFRAPKRDYSANNSNKIPEELALMIPITASKRLCQLESRLFKTKSLLLNPVSKC